MALRCNPCNFFEWRHAFLDPRRSDPQLPWTNTLHLRPFLSRWILVSSCAFRTKRRAVEAIGIVIFHNNICQTFLYLINFVKLVKFIISLLFFMIYISHEKFQQYLLPFSQCQVIARSSSIFIPAIIAIHQFMLVIVGSWYHGKAIVGHHCGITPLSNQTSAIK